MLAFAWLGLVGLLLVGCSSETTNPGSGTGGGGGDASSDTSADAPPDAGDDAADAGGDAEADTGSDAPAEAQSDSGVPCVTSCPPEPNATVACVNGVCTITQCASGWSDCDKVLDNGCEVLTSSDTGNCGACGKVCSPDNGTVACSNGACLVVGCSGSYADCNASGDDGCETSLQVPASCGKCTTKCAAGELCDATGSTPVCVKDCGTQTLCGATCTNTQSDPQNCGACGIACSGANATYSCSAGSCVIASCAAGHQSCDGNPQTGCETNLLTSSAHCGACQQACSGTCVGGLCNPVVSMAVGPFHACALRHDGQVSCWGLNDEGGIGDGTLFLRPAPTPVPGISAKSITAVQNVAATCAVTTAGKLYCWGRNQGGEVGDGTQASPRPSPTVVVSNDAAFATRVFTMVSGFSNGACALDDQGEVWCWGYSQFGQVGSGAANDVIPRATRVPGLSGVISVAAAPLHVCALIQGGTVRCWGRGTGGELGDGLSQSSISPVSVSGLSGVTSLVAGQGATCAIVTAGDLYCWGTNASGAVGNGSTSPAPLPVKSSLSGVQSIGMGRSHVLARTASGFYGWGNNQVGQLLTATPSSFEMSPVAISALPAQATALFGGAGSMCVLSGGGAACWAHDLTGQLGTRNLIVKTTPAVVSNGTSALTGLTHIAAAGFHTCVASAAQVRCGGDASLFKLGQTVVEEGSAVPLPISLPSSPSGPVRGLDAGGHTTCVLKGDDGSREVWCWGANGAGQLGTGATAGNGPAKATGLTDPSALAVGRDFGCALVGSTPHCWGRNANGELGRGTTSTFEAPGPVVGVSTAVALTAGDIHACALLGDGTVTCWGNNGSGQLGTGSTGGATAPTAVSGLTGVTQVRAGPRFTCAIAGAAGDVRCWGANDAGQLGNGNFAAQSLPQAPAVSGASALALGGGHTCAVVAGGAVKCWGRNDNGQLGDGTRISSTAPVTVSGLSGAVELAAGPDPHPYAQHTCARLTNGTAVCWGHNAHGRLLRGESMIVATPSAVAVP